MRTNLSVPYAEKDDAKALGARWDPARKCWYIQDARDLAPFARWLAAQGGSAPAAAAAKVPRTGPAQPPVHCGCAVLPWEPCVHTPSRP